MKYQPVTINEDAFQFCRYGVAVLLWMAVILNAEWLAIVTFCIFTVSAILGVHRSPMIVLFNQTIGRLRQQRSQVVVDIHDIRFVQSLAAFINGIVVILIVLSFPVAARALLLVFAILKTASAFGYCPASKLRTCVLGSNRSCCSVSKILKQ